MVNYRALALAGVSFLSIVSPAFADEQPASGAQASVNDDIIVTARRREERLIDVPKVVDVVNSAELAKNNITKFEDIAQIVPGLNLQNSNNGLVQNTTIRGVAFDVNSGLNSTVEFYMNDGGTQQNYVYQSMYDIGQIEVLRGPQGTLRGRASPSGSITINTKAPDLGGYGGYVSGSIGNNYYGMNEQGAVNVPIIKGILAIRAAGSITDDEVDGVRSAYSTTFPTLPYHRVWSERISARFEPTDNLQFNVVYQHLISHQLSYIQTQSTCLFDPTVSCAGAAGTVTADQRLSTVNGYRNIRQEMDILNGRADWHVFGQKLSYVGAYSIANLTPVNPQDFAGVFTGLAPAGITYNQTVKSRNQYQTHEVRLASEQRIANIFDYVVGYFRLDTPTNNEITSSPQLFPTANTVNFTTPSPAFGGVSLLQALGATNCTVYPSVGYTSCSSASPTLQYGNRTESAFFGNVTAHLIDDKLEISAGARHLVDKNFSNFPNNASLPTDNRRDSAWIWTASASYHVTPDFMLYFNAGSSFRQGASSIGPAVAALTGRGSITPYVYNNFVSIQPETSKSYEGGFKAQFLDHRVGLNVDYYHQDYTNFLYSVPTNTWFVVANAFGGAAEQSSGFLANVPVTVDGIEADGYIRVSQNLRADFSVSYAHGKINGGVIPCNAGLSATPTVAEIQSVSGGNSIVTCRTNGASAFTPPFTFTGSIDYNHEITHMITGYARAQATVYSRSLFNSNSPYDYQNAYGIMNLYVGIRGNNDVWDLSLFVKNLTDTKEILSTYGGNVTASTTLPTTLGGAGVSSPYSYTGYTMPRQVGGTLRLSFGSH